MSQPNEHKQQHDWTQPERQPDRRHTDGASERRRCVAWDRLAQPVVAVAAVRGGRANSIAHAVRSHTDDRRRQHDQRKRHSEGEQSDEGQPRDEEGQVRLECSATDPQHCLDHHGEHRRLQPKEQARDDTDLAPDHVDPAQHHERDDAGQDEQAAGHQAAGRTVHQPADIGGELLRLGPGQQHAVVQRVQEPRLRHPAPFLDEHAMHDRDLPRRTAETQQRDPGPDAQRLVEADAVRDGRVLAAPARRRRRRTGPSTVRPPCRKQASSCGSRPAATAPGVERVVHHHAVLQHRLVVGEIGRQAERDRQQSGRLRCQVGSRRVGAADDDRQPVERRFVQLVVVKERVEAALFTVMRERLGARDVIGRGAGLLGDGEHLLGRHVDELGVLGDEAADQPRTGDAVDLWPLAGDPFAGHACLPL